MEKFIGKSKTYWGLVLILAPIIAPMLGISTAALQLEAIGEAASAVSTGIGGLLVIYGRWKAGGLKLQP